MVAKKWHTRVEIYDMELRIVSTPCCNSFLREIRISPVENKQDLLIDERNSWVVKKA